MTSENVLCISYCVSLKWQILEMVYHRSKKLSRTFILLDKD